MVKIIAAGDMHVPHRASEIPEEFFDVIRKVKPDYLALTGDYSTEEVLDEIIEKVSDVIPRTKIFAVRGNMDRFSLPNEDHIDILGGFVVGIIHGHQIYPRGDLNRLYEYAKQRGWDMLIHGHTHMFSVDMPRLGDVLLVNPGTLTGAWGGLQLGSPAKTFAEIEIVPKKEVVVNRREINDKAEVVATRRIKSWVR